MSAMDGVVPWRERITDSIARSRKIRGGNYVQLATVDSDNTPRCRTVVFRGFAPDGRLKIITDKRSAKVKESRRVEVCWWFSQSSEQYRFAGDITYVGGDGLDDDVALRKQQWGNLSDKAREQFFWAHPPAETFDAAPEAVPGGRPRRGGQGAPGARRVPAGASRARRRRLFEIDGLPAARPPRRGRRVGLRARKSALCRLVAAHHRRWHVPHANEGGGQASPRGDRRARRSTMRGRRHLSPTRPAGWRSRRNPRVQRIRGEPALSLWRQSSPSIAIACGPAQRRRHPLPSSRSGSCPIDSARARAAAAGLPPAAKAETASIVALPKREAAEPPKP